jgi:hypothetical protein
MREGTHLFAATVFSVAATLGLPGVAQTNGAPTDASAGTAEIAKQTELIKAQKDLLEAQNALITERFKLLGEGFGKTGELTFATPDRALRRSVQSCG